MPLETWIMQSSWAFLDDYPADSFIDKMEEAGAHHLAIGAPFPAAPDPGHYGGAIAGCPVPAAVADRKAVIDAFLDAAARRSIHLYAYGANPHMSGDKAVYDQLPNKHVLHADGSRRGVDSYWGACCNGAEFLPYYLGRVRDIHAAYPQIEGFLNDGPEFGYESAFDFMADNLNLFSCFGSCCAARARQLACDFTVFERAALDLHGWFRAIAAPDIERALDHPGDAAAGLAAAAGNEAIAAWLRFKQDAVVSHIERLCAGVKAVDPRLQMGVGSRLPAFTPLTGYDLTRLAAAADFLLPKIYLWMGGVDGLYGTVYRWVRTLREWNPGIAEELLFRFVYGLFGFELPSARSLLELTRHVAPRFADRTELTSLGAPFPADFFAGVVAAQVRAMIDQVGEPARVRPWLHTHHGGRALTPDEIDKTLAAATAAGIETYLNYNPIEPGNWEVAVKHGRREE